MWFRDLFRRFFLMLRMVRDFLCGTREHTDNETNEKVKKNEKKNILSRVSRFFTGKTRASAVKIERKEYPRLKLPDIKIENNYNMNHEERGIAVVLNHEHFANNKQRKGTKQDRKKVQLSFHKLGFKMKIFDDYTTVKIDNQLKKIAAMDHSKNDCLVMVIMTHGLYGQLASQNKYYLTEKIFEYFTDKASPTLKGKPRLFFIQACRGTDRDFGHKMKNGSEDSKYNLHRYKQNSPSETDTYPTSDDPQLVDYIHEPFNHPEFLIVRSTVPNHVSYRHPEKGSWFIQALCDELDVNGKKEDLLTLLTHVNLKVLEHESFPDKEKQILTISSMLTKTLIFNDKNKENDETVEGDKKKD